MGGRRESETDEREGERARNGETESSVQLEFRSLEDVCEQSLGEDDRNGEDGGRVRQTEKKKRETE